MGILAEISNLVKEAQTFSDDGSTFTLGNGQTPSHAVQLWNRLHPDRRITIQQLLAANPGIDQRRYRAGRAYRMPNVAATQTATRPSRQAETNNVPRRVAAPTNTTAIVQAPAAATNQVPEQARGDYPRAGNNPGNLRYYRGIGWFGENAEGLRNGDMNVFDDANNGYRAAARQWINNGRRHPPFTIENIAPHYATTNENDVARYITNVSTNSGIPRDRVIDPDDDGQMVDLMRGVITSESGWPAWRWFTPQESTNNVQRARISL